MDRVISSQECDCFQIVRIDKIITYELKTKGVYFQRPMIVLVGNDAEITISEEVYNAFGGGDLVGKYAVLGDYSFSILTYEELSKNYYVLNDNRHNRHKHKHYKNIING